LENEFYATIRPKRVGSSGERPLQLLREHGIQYIEVRVLDLNPFLPLGIDAEEIRFLDAFLLFCLLADSPACVENEYFETETNLATIVTYGRQQDLTLTRNGKPVAMREWANELLEGMRHSAALLDQVHETDLHAQSLKAQAAKIEDVALTPSA